MAYTKQNYQPGDVLTAEQMNKIQDAVIVNEGNIEGHIENKDNPHGITPEHIGAAPAGFGLGTASWLAGGNTRFDNAAALDELRVNGFWAYQKAGSPLESNYTQTQYVAGYTIASGSGFVTQRAVTLYTGVWIERQLVTRSGVATWQPWEYINPPMELGIEYHTTERVNGKAVYKKNVDGVIQYRLDGETEWKKQNELMGAAPAGYGLGGTARENAPLIKPEDLDSTVRNGWYPYYASNYAKLAGLSFSGGIFVINRYAGAVQIFFPRGDEFVGTYAVRSQKNSGEWMEWEINNPPMALGVEYRTTERWNGKVVYTKLIDFGALPNATEKTVAHGVYPAPFPLSVTVTAKKDSWSFTLPSNYDSETAVMFNSGGVTVKTTIDRSDYNAYATLKYTKD